MIRPLKAFSFLLRAIRLRYRLTLVDRDAPFLGAMSDSGWMSLDLSENCISHLRAMYAKTSGNISLSNEDEEYFREICSIIAPEVKAYLGSKCYIDGMTWLVTTQNLATTRGASNWHTDNVGNRIRLFICIEGDGSQPTLIIPSRHRIPPFKEWIKLTLIETIRWFGLSYKNKFYGEKKLEHKTGAAYLWDSQLFHRGGYETGSSQRILLSMEFSNPEKHQIAKGPIGTKPNLRFSFPAKFLKIEEFNQLVDVNRMIKDGQRINYTEV